MDSNMRIATWNIPYSFRQGSHDEAWEYYLNQIKADYYLGNEIRPPDWVVDEHEVVWSEIGDWAEWGSGIVSPKYTLNEIDIDSEFRGAMIVAESEYTSGVEVTLISIYGLFETIGNVGYATPNLHRMLSDLTGLLDGCVEGQRNIVMGGDLNTSRQFDERSNSTTSQVFFERVRSFGLTNCYEPFYDNFVQTYRHAAGDTPWQNDYLFVSDAWASKLERCEVIDNDRVLEYSDHNPVVVTLDVE